MFATVLSGAIVLVAASLAQAVPGLTSITGIGAIDSSTTKTVTATCPVGTTVVGGGGYAFASHGQAFLTGLRPVVSIFGTGYQALATEDESGYAQPWTPVAVAICAN
jgi:hypothetical protein